MALSDGSLTLKKTDHQYRWRAGWKPRRQLFRPTEDAALRRLFGGRLEWSALPRPPKIMLGERLGEVLLVFAMRALGLEDIRGVDDVLTGTHDFDRKQNYIRIAEHLDRKGRLTYYNEAQKQHQKTALPIFIADQLNKVLPYQVTPGEVRKAQLYRIAQEQE